MAKLAEKGERTFSPIADKLIEAVSSPAVVPPEPAEETLAERKVVPMRREEAGNAHQELPQEAPSLTLLSGSVFPLSCATT